MVNAAIRTANLYTGLISPIFILPALRGIVAAGAEEGGPGRNLRSVLREHPFYRERSVLTLMALNAINLLINSCDLVLSCNCVLPTTARSHFKRKRKFCSAAAVLSCDRSRTHVRELQTERVSPRDCPSETPAESPTEVQNI